MTDESSDRTDSTPKTSATAQNLRDLVERTFLAGMGAAALTKDKVQELIDELVHVGQLNADEGREVVDRLLSRTREDARSVLKRVEGATSGAHREQVSGLQQQVEDHELRIRQLEHRVQLLESALDGKSSGTTA